MCARMKVKERGESLSVCFCMCDHSGLDLRRPEKKKKKKRSFRCNNGLAEREQSKLQSVSSVAFVNDKQTARFVEVVRSGRHQLIGRRR